MTAAALRVPHQPPQTLRSWFRLIDPPVGESTGIILGAAYYNGVTYIGYNDGNGNIRVAAYNHAAETVTVSPAIITGASADHHATPSVLVRQSDHKILIACAFHATAHMYVAVSTNAEDVSAWGAATDIGGSLGGTSIYTYANLHQLSAEAGKIYLFYRDGNPAGAPPTAKLSYVTSTDGGSTWSAVTVLYNVSSKASYWTIASDGTSRIDFATSDGVADNGDIASLYHFYYTGGSLFKTDGTLISTALPLGAADITKLFDGATNGHVRVPYSVHPSGPTIVWVAYDTAGAGFNEHYWYGRFSGGAWSVNQVNDTGSPPTLGFVEGGLAIDHADTSTLYVFRLVSGQWQMFLYKTTNGGSTWTSTQLTFDADQPNTYPIVPRDADPALKCVWLFGPRNSDYSFGTQLRGFPRGRTR